MRREELIEILKKYSTGRASAEEKALVEAWYEQYGTEDQIINEVHLQNIEDEIFERLPTTRVTLVRKLWPRIAAAASILFVLSIGSYFIHHKKPKTENQFAQNKLQGLKPGRNQATLTLGNGKQIVIYKGLSGKLAQQGNTLVQVNNSNALVYTPGTKNTSRKIEFNTLSTSRGEQSPYPLNLPDGTKVWLNSASSITFPTEFSGINRSVTLTGEAYFEVAHNPAKPFDVNAKGQTVEVLGTHFNINAYDDEPSINTTLLEGKVKVIKGNNVVVLKPGQQAVNSQKDLKVELADTEMAIAWKNGLFKFDNADVPTLMRQLSRWYNVDIVYDGMPPSRRFSGKIYRNVNALTIADILSYKKIHFRIDGQRIIVMP